MAIEEVTLLKFKRKHPLDSIVLFSFRVHVRMSFKYLFILTNRIKFYNVSVFFFRSVLTIIPVPPLVVEKLSAKYPLSAVQIVYNDDRAIFLLT